MTHEIKKQYKPVQALIVYETSDYNKFYIENRMIINGNMGAGAPLTEDVVNKLIKKFKPIKTIEKVNVGGFVPENLIYQDFDNGLKVMIWWRPAEQRNMFFAKSLNIPDGLAFIPPLIYKVKNNSLSVFAFDTEKPKPKTKLFEPPFHNCSSGGSVCLGSAKTKLPENNTYEEIMAYWEKLFWGSEFTHNGSAEAFGNLNLFWNDQITTGKEFDLTLLKPTKKKLKDII